MASSGKCIFCGEPSILWSPKTMNLTSDFTNRHRMIFSKWKEQCARTLCEILFGNKKHLYRYYFKQKYAYCSICQQIVRDVQFTWKQIELLQHRLEELTTTLRNRLHANYVSIDKNNIHTSTTEKHEDESVEIKNINSKDSKIMDNIANYSYNNAILLIYKAASKVCETAWPTSENSEILFESVEKLPNDNSDIDKKVKIKMEVVEVESFEENCLSSDQDHISEGEVNSDTKKKIVIPMHGRPMRKSASAALTKFEKYDSDDSFSEGYDDVDFRQDSDSIEFPNSKDSPSQDKKVSKTKKKIKSRPPILEIDEKVRRERERKRAYAKKHRELYGRNYIVKRIPCTVENCKIKFNTEEAKDIHFKEVHSGIERPFECIKCSKNFAKYTAYKQHQSLVHSGAKRYDHYCKFCGKGYEKEEELASHYSTSHLGPNPFYCAFCDQSYNNSVDLRLHMRNVHPDSETFMCDVCGKTCATQISLNQHIKYHGDPESLFKCTMCSYVTISAASLKSHMERHGTEAIYTCEICGKTFNSKPAMKSHSLIHEPKIQKFECNICGKSFSNSNACKKHEMTHTGVKNHICGTCGRAFALKYNLRAHEKIHLREKGFDIPMRNQRTYIKKPPS